MPCPIAQSPIQIKEKPPVITKHDPNIYYQSCTVTATLMTWDYVGYFTAEVGGNVKGFDHLENAADYIYDKLADAAEEDHYSIVLTNPEGETVEVEIDDADDIKKLMVAVELTRHEKDKI